MAQNTVCLDQCTRCSWKEWVFCFVWVQCAPFIPMMPCWWIELFRSLLYLIFCLLVISFTDQHIEITAYWNHDYGSIFLFRSINFGFVYFETPLLCPYSLKIDVEVTLLIRILLVILRIVRSMRAGIMYFIPVFFHLAQKLFYTTYYTPNKWLINEWKNASSSPRSGPFLSLAVGEKNKLKSLLSGHFSYPVNTCLIWEAYTEIRTGVGKVTYGSAFLGVYSKWECHV